ncbi:hypothetical protein EX30DRAFT_369010 [Ascodesmis nigricans]|uniref:J domain-containing protein n=1 Tax=Ascodesmis nigricans TaxID=341454 RepID=A0A4S2N3I0_9PEZI|nr:hypothetical protein EX30DRAFT_369010 [Ascodesmis nigricans]
MADIPSHHRQPPRPSPPSGDHRRSGRGIPTPRTPTSPTAQRGSPTNHNSHSYNTTPTNGNTAGGLRPPFSPQRRPGMQASRGATGRQMSFATSREEFTFSDSELSGEAEDEDDEEVLLDEDEKEDEEDYYAILGVPRNATTAQIRNAYHALSLKFHPDKQAPELRDKATETFNSIVVAYETLNNPHKRVVYDKLGIQGIKEKVYQLGIKSMSPEQFELWLKDAIEKQKEQRLEEFVKSQGSLAVYLNCCGLLFADAIIEPIQDSTGRIVSEKVYKLPLCVVTQMVAKQAWTVPMGWLGDLLNTPLRESDRKSLENEDAPKTPSNVAWPDPQFTFTTSLGGQVMHNKKTRQIENVVCSPEIRGTISHNFPSLPPTAPLSVASLLSGTQTMIDAHILPHQSLTTAFSKGLGPNLFTVQSTVTPQSPFSPNVMAQVQRKLGLRHHFVCNVGTGAPITLPFLLSLFSLPEPGTMRPGMATIGYHYDPFPNVFAGDPNDPRNPFGRRKRKSQHTESYGIFAIAGPQVGGALLRLNWSRSFFIATPIGSYQRRHNPKPAIKLFAEMNVSVAGFSSYELRATRKVSNHTALGLSLSVGGASGQEGVALGLVWKRLGQKITIPVLLAPLVDAKMTLYGFFFPVLTYTAIELLYLRPHHRRVKARDTERIRRKHAAHIARRREEALEAQQIMRTSVLRRREAERLTGGLVILEAKYGAKSQWADVTIPLQNMVEGGQVVIEKGVDKKRLLGWWDPEPAREKVVEVQYEWGGKRHRAVVKDGQGLVLPLRSHLDDDE